MYNSVSWAQVCIVACAWLIGFWFWVADALLPTVLLLPDVILGACSPEKGRLFTSVSSKASVLSSPQHNGSEHTKVLESHLLLIEDMARKLLMGDELAAVLRHCNRVSSQLVPAAKPEWADLSFMQRLNKTLPPFCYKFCLCTSAPGVCGLNLLLPIPPKEEFVWPLCEVGNLQPCRCHLSTASIIPECWPRFSLFCFLLAFSLMETRSLWLL